MMLNRSHVLQSCYSEVSSVQGRQCVCHEGALTFCPTHLYTSMVPFSAGVSTTNDSPVLGIVLGLRHTVSDLFLTTVYKLVCLPLLHG